MKNVSFIFFILAMLVISSCNNNPVSKEKEENKFWSCYDIGEELRLFYFYSPVDSNYVMKFLEANATVFLHGPVDPFARDSENFAKLMSYFDDTNATISEVSDLKEGPFFVLDENSEKLIALKPFNQKNQNYRPRRSHPKKEARIYGWVLGIKE